MFDGTYGTIMLVIIYHMSNRENMKILEDLHIFLQNLRSTDLTMETYLNDKMAEITTQATVSPAYLYQLSVQIR